MSEMTAQSHKMAFLRRAHEVGEPTLRVRNDHAHLGQTDVTLATMIGLLEWDPDMTGAVFCEAFDAVPLEVADSALSFVRSDMFGAMAYLRALEAQGRVRPLSEDAILRGLGRFGLSVELLAAWRAVEAIRVDHNRTVKRCRRGNGILPTGDAAKAEALDRLLEWAEAAATIQVANPFATRLREASAKCFAPYNPVWDAWPFERQNTGWYLGEIGERSNPIYVTVRVADGVLREAHFQPKPYVPDLQGREHKPVTEGARWRACVSPTGERFEVVEGERNVIPETVSQVIWSVFRQTSTAPSLRGADGNSAYWADKAVRAARVSALNHPRWRECFTAAQAALDRDLEHTSRIEHAACAACDTQGIWKPAHRNREVCAAVRSSQLCALADFVRSAQ